MGNPDAMEGLGDARYSRNDCIPRILAALTRRWTRDAFCDSQLAALLELGRPLAMVRHRLSVGRHAVSRRHPFWVALISQ